MSRLPNVNPNEMIRALRRAGFEDDKQRGSHFYLKHPASGLRTGVPIHSGDLDRTLMKKILKQAGLSEDAFRNLL